MQDSQQIKTITPNELSEILDGLRLSTITLFLENFQFSKFRLSQQLKKNAKYKVCTEFLKTLYIMLWNKGHYKEADRLEKHFEQDFKDVLYSEL